MKECYTHATFAQSTFCVKKTEKMSLQKKPIPWPHDKTRNVKKTCYFSKKQTQCHAFKLALVAANNSNLLRKKTTHFLQKKT